MLTDLVRHYSLWDEEAELCGSSDELRRRAQTLVNVLGDMDVLLLGRHDPALMVCAAAAVMREARTRVERAPLGRTGWTAPAGAILVEPIEPAPSLLANLHSLMSGGSVIVLGSDATATVLNLAA